MKTYFVYILKCCDASYYTGITNNIDRRLEEHNEGIDPFCYTLKRRPLELVFLQDFREVKEAIAFEKQVKGWGRKKKLAIIEGNWERLKSLAECRNKTTHRNFENGFDSPQSDNRDAIAEE